MSSVESMAEIGPLATSTISNEQCRAEGKDDMSVINEHVSDLEVKFRVNPLDVPPAWMIGARTHLTDCWDPQPEWLRQPGITLCEEEFCVSTDRDDRCTDPSSGSSADSMSVKGVYHDVRIHGGSNIAHAILGGAMTSLACKSAARTLGIDDRVTAIIPAQTAAYVREIYNLLGIPTIATGRSVTGRQMRTDFNVVATLGLANMLLPQSLAIQLNADRTPAPKRIYLARQGSRSISNSQEIEALFRREGFTTIFPERLPVFEQIRYLWNAELVAGVHGAALGALLFRVLCSDLRPVCLLELFGPGYIVTLYRHLVAAIGGKWVGIRGRVTPGVVYDLDVIQGNGFLRKVSATLRGCLPQGCFPKETAWQRAHQSSNFAIDPETVKTAIESLLTTTAEPYPRRMAPERWIHR